MVAQIDTGIDQNYRRTDEQASCDAGEAIENSGKGRAHREHALALIKAHPGKTAKKLSELPECTLEYHQLQRRLHEVVKANVAFRRQAGGQSGEWRYWPSRDKMELLARAERIETEIRIYPEGHIERVKYEAIAKRLRKEAGVEW